jgi:uncharacterized coiled-coil DUF342 family protein
MDMDYFMTKRQLRDEIHNELMSIWKSMDTVNKEATETYEKFLSTNAWIHPIRWWKLSKEHHRLSEIHHGLYLQSQSLLAKFHTTL